MFLVIELQVNDGTMTTLSYQFDDINLAYQQYYSILSSASVSKVDIHSAIIVNEFGAVIRNDSFDHRTSEN